jgi:hypothetical protein
MPEQWERVRRFISRYLRTVEQLEVLLLVSAAPERYWSAAEAGQALAIPAEDVGVALEHLTATGLLDVRLLDDVRYRFSPTDEDRSGGVRELQSAYASQRIRVVSEIARRRSRPMVEFADAFRLHSEDSEEDKNDG